MKKRNLLIFFISCVALFNFTYAQEHKCGFDHQHENIKKVYLKNKLSNQELLRRIGVAEHKLQRNSDIYVIPVVFHVFGEATNDERVNVSYELIDRALRQTTEDFRGLTADYNQTGPSSRFETIKKPMNIEFRLAKINPDGLPTKGVIFYDEAIKGLGQSSGYDEIIKRYAWDNSKYMNVYITNDLYDDSDLYNSGVSWLPNNWMSSENLARVVYNGSYIGTNTTENFRRVLTHEFGHFFGLHHTFQGGCTYPNDNIDDTPPVASPSWPINDVNCEGNFTDWENFMNYTDAYRHFTKDQINLMTYHLNETACRQTLWQEANLIATGVNNEYKATPSLALVKGAFLTEDEENIGSFSSSLEIEAIEGMSFSKTGILSINKDYFVDQIPEGLDLKIKIEDPQKAIITLEGNSINHTTLNNINKVKLTISSTALQSKENNSNQEIQFGILFLDPYTDLCMFNPRYSPYAHISKVKFAQISKSTEFDDLQYKDFRKDYVAGLEKGKTYPLDVTVENWKSGENDPYTVRAWFDWNGDFILQPNEMITPKNISKIGKAGTKHDLSLNVTVPDHFIEGKEVAFRVMLHYTMNNDGEDPCGTIDSGDVEDYGMIFGEENAHVIPDDNTIIPEDYVCIPEFSYRPYAYIEKFEFANVKNSSPATLEDIQIVDDFTELDDMLIKLEKNKTYEMTIYCKNIDSGTNDSYTVRSYIDWNRNNVLEKSESQKVFIEKIGKDSEHRIIKFNWTVPEEAITDERIHVRAFVHFGGGESSFEGENPCSKVENGHIEEYKAIIPSPMSFDEVNSDDIYIYPNPTDGIIYIKGIETVDATYSLYSLSGMKIKEGIVIDSEIDIRNTSKGIYILKIKTNSKNIQKNIIIK